MFERFENLQLERPLAILDLETTGLDLQRDRIVEFAVLRVHPDGNFLDDVKDLVRSAIAETCSA